jgi:hypothetical protein
LAEDGICLLDVDIVGGGDERRPKPSGFPVTDQIADVLGGYRLGILDEMH